MGASVTMKKSFAARRVPRKIGGDEEHETLGQQTPGTDPSFERLVNNVSDLCMNSPLILVAESAVKRPALNKTKRPSSRVSLASDGDGDESTTFIPKKSNLSRIAAERNAERIAAKRDDTDNARPSYNKDYLEELKSSTPSKPKDLDDSSKALDVAAKFGPPATLQNTHSSIPSEAEIREKKERRKRLAKENEFIALNDGEEAAEDEDEDDNEFKPRDITARTKEKYAETRLVHDDEDFAEGFEDFTEDGKISLGKKAEREQEKKRRKEMQETIQEAEGGDSDQSGNDSEAERNEAYERAQTKAGTYSSRDVTQDRAQRPKTPPKITPLPELGKILERLRGNLAEMEMAKGQKEQRLRELKEEKQDSYERGIWIQNQLKEAGERFEELRAEAAVHSTNGGDAPQKTDGRQQLLEDRGLESLGAPSAPSGMSAIPRSGSYDSEDE